MDTIKYLYHRTRYWKVTKTQEKITHKRAMRSALFQKVTTRLQGTYKTERQRQTLNTNYKDFNGIHNNTTLLRSKLLEGLSMFDCTNITLISVWDQDTLMFGSHERSITYRCIISLYIQINKINWRYNKDKYSTVYEGGIRSNATNDVK